MHYFVFRSAVKEVNWQHYQIHTNTRSYWKNIIARNFSHVGKFATFPLVLMCPMTTNFHFLVLKIVHFLLNWGFHLCTPAVILVILQSQLYDRCLMPVVLRYQMWCAGKMYGVHWSKLFYNTSSQPVSEFWLYFYT